MEKQDLVGRVIARLQGRGVNARKGSNFDIRVDKADAERMLMARALCDFRNEDAVMNPYLPPFTGIMCAEYGEDDDWCGVEEDDLRHNLKLDDDYQTFELWLETHPVAVNAVEMWLSVGAESTPKSGETPRCSNCGYYGVTTDAVLSWDFDEQEWVIDEMTGYSVCGKCNETVDYSFGRTTAELYRQNLEDDVWEEGA